MGLKFRGEKVSAMDFSKITPGEVRILERQVGMAFPLVQRAMKTCVCGHLRNDHDHKDDNAELTDDTACVKCDASCDEFAPNVPSDVNTTLLWLGIKRKVPTVTYKEIEDTPYEDLADDEPDEEPANPT